MAFRMLMTTHTFTTIPTALDHILNKTLIILPLPRAKTSAARYTTCRTAPTVHKALRLLICVQYLRSAKRNSRARASFSRIRDAKSFVSRPTSPKTQFTSAEAHGTFTRRADSASISAVDVSANASGSEQGQATGQRGKTPPTNVTLRGGGTYYTYPIGKIPGLRGGAGTPEPGESDTRPGDDRLLPAHLWRLQAEWVDHLLWTRGTVISIELNAPGVQAHLAR